jgi:hypothetical protein
MLTRIKILKITFMALRLSVNRPMPFSFTYESVREICVTALSCFYIREWRERKNEIAGFVILARDDRQCTLSAISSDADTVTDPGTRISLDVHSAA